MRSHGGPVGVSSTHADEFQLVDALTGGPPLRVPTHLPRPPGPGGRHRARWVSRTGPAVGDPKGQPVTRRLSGFKPTGHLQLGNYLGAIRPMVDSPHHTDSVVAVVDLHALTITHDPPRVRALTLEAATLLLAAGVDPDVSLLYVQSHVPRTHRTALPAGVRDRLRRGPSDDPVPGEVDRPDPAVAADVPGADGRRHPAARRRRGAGRHRPDAASGARARRRGPLQRPLRAHVH